MSFSNEKIKIPSNLYTEFHSTFFKNIRTTSFKKAARNRQCFKCRSKINKNARYVNHQFKYDYTIKTISFCINCFK